MEIKAYAKINLTLEVLGRRPDGYHEVRTVLQTIDLTDILNITRASHLKMECSVPELGNKDNLVWKAASALRRAAECDKGAKIHLEKHIPVGMGLGGGSSDAAATLKALNNLWGIQMHDAGLQSIAASLGSDVPFFLRGGTALGEGRGEVMTELHPLPQLWMVLCCSPSRSSQGGGPFPDKTARLYSMVAPENYTDGSHTSSVVDFIESCRNPTVDTEEAGPLPSLFNV
ncbi:MAG: 4-(cytidine 5'-diphospho)-2-C-methyl-D-erythritol kinase, partial [Dehalococcoidia bacterium]|nr:4-(cytidine 5'-diphospho)-2-C-methyl-D-erythritol kinase [Dehalococcoidia bacterium]